jgi:hypothetical protein
VKTAAAFSNAWQPRRHTQTLLAALLLLFSCSSYSAAAPNWTVTAKPARLLNGAPVLFEVKPSTQLDSLTGTWLGHQLTFTYDSSTKLWFVLAGVTFETKPGKYTLELSGERVTSKVSFKREFPVAAASYPQIKVQLAVEKKFTEPNPEQESQIAEAGKIKDAPRLIAHGMAISTRPSRPRLPTSTVHSAFSMARRKGRTGDSITASTRERRLRR